MRSKISVQICVACLLSVLIGFTLQLTKLAALDSSGRQFGQGTYAGKVSFLAVFGACKAVANLAAGWLAPRLGYSATQAAGWLLGAPMLALLAAAAGGGAGGGGGWGWGWGAVVGSTAALGVQQGLCWSVTMLALLALLPATRRGLAAGLNETLGYTAIATAAPLYGILESRFVTCAWRLPAAELSDACRAAVAPPGGGGAGEVGLGALGGGGGGGGPAEDAQQGLMPAAVAPEACSSPDTWAAACVGQCACAGYSSLLVASLAVLVPTGLAVTLLLMADPPPRPGGGGAAGGADGGAEAEDEAKARLLGAQGGGLEGVALEASGRLGRGSGGGREEGRSSVAALAAEGLGSAAGSAGGGGGWGWWRKLARPGGGAAAGAAALHRPGAYVQLPTLEAPALRAGRGGGGAGQGGRLEGQQGLPLSHAPTDPSRQTGEDAPLLSPTLPTAHATHRNPAPGSGIAALPGAALQPHPHPHSPAHSAQRQHPRPPAPAAGWRAAARRFRAAFAHYSLRNRSTAAMCVAGLASNTLTALAWGLLLTWARDALGVPGPARNLLAAAYSFLKGLVQLFAGALSDAAGRKWLVAAGLALNAAGLLTAACGAGWGGALLGPDVLPSQLGVVQYGYLLLGSCLMGAGGGLYYPVMAAAVADHAAGDGEGALEAGMATFRFWRDLGYAAGALGGPLADAVGVEATLVGFAGVCLAVAALVGSVYMERPPALDGHV